MFDWLTGGIGSAIGGLAGGLGSVFGSLFNTSSQQSINAANLQQQMAIASGAQLPGLVRNAQAAGLNPLAVLGQSAPGGMAAVGTDPGKAFAAGGQTLSNVISEARAGELAEQQLLKAKVDVANARTQGNNMAIAGARDAWLTDAMQAWHLTHPDWAPSLTGPQAPTPTSLADTAFRNIPNVPGQIADWMFHKLGPPPDINNSQQYP